MGFVLPGVALVVGLGAVPVHGAPGDADPSFGTNGVVVTSITSLEDRANAGAIQADGKILAGGLRSTSSTTSDFQLVRFLPNGALDPGFGAGGVVTTTIASTAEIQSVLVQPDGKIVAGGYAHDGTSYGIALVRYDPAGVPDPGFGTGGVVNVNLGAGNDRLPREFLLQPDGRLVAVIEARVGANQMFALARFEPDGSPDTLFGVGGEVLTDIVPSSDFPFSGALQPDGRILAVGNAFGAPYSGQVVVRYEADGSLDPTFGTGGIVGLGIGTYGTGVAVQPDGRIVVGGEDSVGGFFDFTLARLDSTGALDPSFGSGGLVYTAVGAEDDFNVALAIQPDGKILAAGQVETGVFTSSFGVVRYEPDGSLDVGFGAGGVALTSFGFFISAGALDIVLQPDARIVLVGARTNLGPRDFALTRYFGGDCGNATVEPDEQCDDGNALAGDCCSPTCEFEPAGGPCTTDGDACTDDTCSASGTCQHTAVTCDLCKLCDSTLGCVGVPRSGCLGTAPGGRSSFELRDSSPDTRDSAKWKWRSGTMAVGDFGDPLATDDYALCVYEGAAADLWIRMRAPAGGTCVSRPCWKPLTPTGAKYADRELSPDGIGSLVLRSNVPGQMQMKLKAKGPWLVLPSLDTLDLPVRIQLQRTGGACWDVTYATARVATTQAFRAKTE